MIQGFDRKDIIHRLKFPAVKPSYCNCGLSAPQTIPNATLTVIEFDTKTYDRNDEFNLTDFEWQPIIPANKMSFFDVEISIEFTANLRPGAMVDIEIRKNGTPLLSSKELVPALAIATFHCFANIEMLQGDVLDFRVFQDAAGTRDLTDVGRQCRVEIIKFAECIV